MKKVFRTFLLALIVPLALCFAGCGEKPKTEEQIFQGFNSAFVGTYNYVGTKTTKIESKSCEKTNGQIKAESRSQKVITFDAANHVGAKLEYVKSENEKYYKPEEDKLGLFLKEAKYISKKDDKFVYYAYERQLEQQELLENKIAAYVDEEYAKFEFGVFDDEKFAALVENGMNGGLEKFKLFLKTSILENVQTETEIEPKITISFLEEGKKQKFVVTVALETDFNPPLEEQQAADATYTLSKTWTITALYEGEKLGSFNEQTEVQIFADLAGQTTLLSELTSETAYTFSYTYSANLMPDASELETYRGTGENGEIEDIKP